ncbi:MAG: response regulator [bacterium]|nr:response regulator [bacterium]
MQKKILLVDDESSLRRTMALGLTQRGYYTESCENGVNALKKVETYIKNNIPLDGIVVDIRLPDIDGIKLAKIMKFKCPGVPIILITGFADRYDMDEIRDLKVSAFLEKPFGAEELSDQFVQVMEAEEKAKRTATAPETEEAVSVSGYMMINIAQDADFFETYEQLYYMENIVYCDAVKGDFDVILLAQGNTPMELRNMESQLKAVAGVEAVHFVEMENPLLDAGTLNLIEDAEVALDEPGRERDLSNKVSSYVVMEVEREKLSEVFPVLCLHENVVYCDYSAGKMVLFVTGNYFDDIDRFVTDKINNLNGILKVKEYPIINMFEM